MIFASYFLSKSFLFFTIAVQTIFGTELRLAISRSHVSQAHLVRIHTLL